MNCKLKFLLRYSFFLGLLATFFSCSSPPATTHEPIPEPKIKAGVAKIQGKIDNPSSKGKVLTLSYHNPITLIRGSVEINVEQDGSFYLEAPIECNPCLGVIVSPVHSLGLPILLTSDEKMFIELTSNNQGHLVSVKKVSFLESSISNVNSKYNEYRYDIIKNFPHLALRSLSRIHYRLDY